MKVQLLRAAKIQHSAGEIVEVSPAAASFLLSVGSAVRLEDALTPPPQKTTKAKPKK